MKLTVNLGEHSYPIYIENHISEHTASYIKEVFQGKKIMIVSDDSVYPLYGERILSSLNTSFFHMVRKRRTSTISHAFTRRFWMLVLPEAIFSLRWAAV